VTAREAARARVVIADDERLFRSGLAELLGADERIEIVGQAADGEEAVRLAESLSPDVVLMDLKMPVRDGLDATAQIVAEHPEVKVLVLTTFDAERNFVRALRAGAGGYVLKDSPPEAVVSSILAVASGERVLANAVADRALGVLTGEIPTSEFYDGLTRRELEILRLLASGFGNDRIARELHISGKTVRNHVSRTYEKLGIHDRSQAIVYAARKGLIDP
jgi:DNA-binding NarL/FixJ family response regulator